MALVAGCKVQDRKVKMCIRDSFMNGFRLAGMGILWAVLKVFAIVLILTLIRTTNPRVRIKQAVSFFFIWMNLIAIVALVLIAFGY